MKCHRLDGTVVVAHDDCGQLRFFVQNRDDSIQRFHYKGKFYEEEDLELISNYVSDDGVFLDIGANVGNHTVFLARKFPNVTIFPVEIFDKVIDILKINIDINRLVNVDLRYLGLGLGNESKRGRVVSNHENNLGLVRLVSDAEGEVPILTGDELFFNFEINFIKIDVEGGELDVLFGLQKIIDKCRPIIFIEVANSNADKFKEWCACHGYNEEERVQRYKANINFLISPR